MRKRVFGRRFKKDYDQRKALFRSLMGSFVLHGSIKTTEARAKSIKGDIEKLVTQAKNKGEAARRNLQKHLANEEVVEKIITRIAPLYIERPGGYTRLLRLNNRLKDNARMVMLQWVESDVVLPEIALPKKAGKGPKTKKTISSKVKTNPENLKTKEKGLKKLVKKSGKAGKSPAKK